MSGFGDLFANPIKTLTAPFDKREGQPWLQGVARNFGHAAFGDKIGNYVDQNYLGDPAQGAKGPAPMSVQPQIQMQSQTQNPLMAMIQQMMQAKGGMK